MLNGISAPITNKRLPVIELKSLRSHLDWMNLVLNFLTHLQFGLFKIKTCLEVKLELWGGAEETRKPEGCIGTHTTALTDDFINPRRGNTKRHRERVGAHPKRLKELLPENLAGVYWSHIIFNHLLLLSGNPQSQRFRGH